MDRDQAREVLIDALVQQNVERKSAEVESWLRYGFRGYGHMFDMELVIEAEDTLLRSADVNQAITILRKLYEE